MDELQKDIIWPVHLQHHHDLLEMAEHLRQESYAASAKPGRIPLFIRLKQWLQKWIRPERERKRLATPIH